MASPLPAGRRSPILLCVRDLGIGGIERDVAKLATRLDRNRFDVRVGCFYARGLRLGEIQQAGVPVIEFPVRSFRSPSVLRAASVLSQYLRTNHIQLIHSYDVPTTQFTVPVAKLCRTPVVLSSQLGYRDLFTAVDRRILRVTDRLVNRIVVNCEAMRRHLIEDERVPASRIHLCYNGVDTGVFFPARRPKPDVLKGASLVIGIVCALRPEKRVDLLIEAFARIRHLRSSMKLLIVGSGPLLDDLQTRAVNAGVAADCVFQPATSDVSGWMQAIDVFVLPSDSEAFSNSLLESMACGCCPVGSRVGGTPELILDQLTGLLFQPGDAEDLAGKLEALIGDNAKLLAMSAAAAAFARDKFSIQRAASVMGDLYSTLLDGATIKRRIPGPLAGPAE